MRYTKQCPICNTEYRTYRETQRTCSNKCKHVYQVGENNPNYGNKWSEEQRKNLSDHQKSVGDIISKRVKADWVNNDSRRESAAKIMSVTMRELYKTNPELWNCTHSEETKKLIGLKSKEKFNNKEFTDAYRKTMEDRGYWLTIDKKDKYIYYRESADWVSKMWDIVPTEYDITTIGVFNVVTNPIGLVRDHKLGRRLGFELKIFPELLRHPANCQIITNVENIKKAQQDSDSIITYFELFNAIDAYDKEWKEQEKCIELIQKFLKGDRWVPEGG